MTSPPVPLPLSQHVSKPQSGAAGTHVWERMDPFWHLAFAGFVTAGAVLVAAGAGPPGTRGVALALIAAVALVYAVAGGRALSRAPGGALGTGYLAVAVPLVLGLFAVNAVGGGVLLFVLFPHLWRLLTTRAAAAATVATSLGIVAVRIVEDGTWDPAGIAAQLGWMGAVVVMALLLGLWITRITAQSVRRAELVAELRATREELAAADRDRGASAERERLSREIHDTLAQGFASILLLARDDLDHDMGRVHLRRIQDTARENLAESRALVAALAPAPLGDATLPAALRRLVARVGEEHRMTATTDVRGAERALTAAQDVVLLRVSQEALANVRKHADARVVELVLDYREPGVALSIRDDGRGFDPGAVGGAIGPAGFGLSGMRDRVRDLGGALTVDSAPGAGTCVRVRLG